MKYNDKASRGFHIRSYNRDDFNTTDRQERRREQRLLQDRVKSVSNHYLCYVMTKKDLFEIYNEFRYGTGGLWHSEYRSYPDFKGDYIEFIEYLIKRGDERLSNITTRYRDRNINSILS